MPILSRFVSLRSSFGWPVLVAGALLVVPGVALAQMPPVAPRPASSPAPFALTTPPARSQTVSVLIIALDDPMLAGSTGAPSSDRPLTGAPLSAEPSFPDVPLTALPPSPTSWNGAPLGWNWSVLAKKKPSQPAQPDPRFLPVPDPPSNLTPANTFGSPSTANSATPSTSSVNPLAGTSTAPEAAFPPRSSAPAGRTMLAAVSLRRALIGLGYANVEAVSPDSNLIARTIGDGRLTPGTLSTLRGALQALAATSGLAPTDRSAAIAKATQTASDAAAALGQATGYRAVVGMYVGPLAGGKQAFSMVLSDSARESGEPILWDESAPDESSARDSGAATGAALLDKSVRVWPLTAPVSTRTLADAHMAKAKAAGAAGNIGLAQDEVLRVSTLDPSRAEAYSFLGDLLAPTDPAGAATAYRRATQINQKDGDTFAKIAITLIDAPTPDFPRVLQAGKQAILNGTDTAELRIAMARAQFGRAELFRRADQLENAEDAETDAQTNLDRALQLAPNNPEALKLMARALITSGRTAEGVRFLDRVAPLYPKDADLQFQYALALLAEGDRKEDAFVAFSRVWKTRGQGAGAIDDVSAQLLLQGFDEHIFALGKAGRQLSEGVAGGSIAREGAYLQLTRLKADMSDASDALALMRPPSGTSGQATIARTFAASLMSQSLEAQQTFLDTGQDMYRTRANDLFRQAVAQLNSARVGR